MNVDFWYEEEKKYGDEYVYGGEVYLPSNKAPESIVIIIDGHSIIYYKEKIENNLHNGGHK